MKSHFSSIKENPASVLHEADDVKPAYADKQDTDALSQFVGFHDVGTHMESPCSTSSKPQSITTASNPDFNEDSKSAYTDKQDTDALMQFVGFHDFGTHIESPCTTSNQPQSHTAASNPEFNDDSMSCSSSSNVNESDCEEHEPDSPRQLDHSTLTLTPKSSNRSFLAM